MQSELITNKKIGVYAENIEGFNDLIERYEKQVEQLKETLRDLKYYRFEIGIEFIVTDDSNLS